MTTPEPRKIRGLARYDGVYQQKVADVLAKLCEDWEAGKIDGIYVVVRELNDEGKWTIGYRRAAMMDSDVSWAAVSMLFAEHLERVP